MACDDAGAPASDPRKVRVSDNRDITIRSRAVPPRAIARSDWESVQQVSVAAQDGDEDADAV